MKSRQLTGTEAVFLDLLPDRCPEKTTQGCKIVFFLRLGSLSIISTSLWARIAHTAVRLPLRGIRLGFSPATVLTITNRRLFAIIGSLSIFAIDFID
jgi:hypothetical protein